MYLFVPVNLSFEKIGQLLHPYVWYLLLNIILIVLFRMICLYVFIIITHLNDFINLKHIVIIFVQLLFIQHNHIFLLVVVCFNFNCYFKNKNLLVVLKVNKHFLLIILFKIYIQFGIVWEDHRMVNTHVQSWCRSFKHMAGNTSTINMSYAGHYGSVHWVFRPPN